METDFFSLFYSVEHWAPQCGGAAIDRACVLCAEGNSVAGFQLSAKSFTSPTGSQNTTHISSIHKKKTTLFS